jgi:glutamine synthetase
MNLHRSALSDEAGAARLGAAEVESFLAENPNIQYIDCIFVDLCGNVRGKRIASDELQAIFQSGIPVPGSIYFLDARGEPIEGLPREAQVAGTAWPVAASLTRVSWSQRPHGQVLMALRDAKGEPYFGEPRNVLKRVVSRFADFDTVPTVAIAIDAYIVESAKGLPRDPATIDAETLEGIKGEIAAAAATQAIPPLTIADGRGAGQIRIEVKASDDPILAADHAVFLRQVIRAVARQRKLDALFMAKPFLAPPGSGMRARADVRRPSRESIFAGAEGGQLARFAVGGLQAVMAESIALFAPNINAVRRHQGAGALPRNKRWGYANAATNLSIESGPEGALYVEHRIATADANPYLVLAAVLAGMHHGISQNIDPGQPAEGGVASFADPTFPFNIDAALVALENGSVLREYLGPAYVDLYCATKRAELERFRNFIPPHEHDWYA